MRSYVLDGPPENMNQSKEGGRFIRDKKGRIVYGRVPIGDKRTMRGVHDLNRGAKHPVKTYRIPKSKDEQSS